MTSKKRVHELAKEYGLTGLDLVAKLKDWNPSGVASKVKGPQSALDEGDLMVIEVALEARGHRRAERSSSATGDAAAGDQAHAGGVVIKRKKKIVEAGPESAAARESAAPASPASTAEQALHGADLSRPATALSSAAPSAAPGAPPGSQVSHGATLEPAAPPHGIRDPGDSRVAALRGEPAEAGDQAPSDRSSERPAGIASVPAGAHSAEPDAEASAELAPHGPYSTGGALSATPAAAASAEVGSTESEAIAAPGADDKRGDAELKPASRKAGPAGKIVGFIDLTKVAGAQRKPESRRLKSPDDEAAPKVMPTLGRDKKKAFQRSDAAGRTQLTLQQQRERESARFLRNKRSPTQGGASPAPVRRQPRPADGAASPHSGQSVTVEAPITVKQLAEGLSIKAGQLLILCNKMLGFGAVNINSLLDEDTAILLAHEFGVELTVTQEIAAEEEFRQQFAEQSAPEAERVTRPPVVAVLGHVDHGKTTLIDSIRKSQIAEGEAGGITQHIGAYQVETKRGHVLTVIDTPGHAAFTRMRARGAKAVDIVILVVAADDGPMPQTLEALQHARAAKVPVVVAVNKIDKPGANPDNVKNQLAKHELIPEEWGGHTAYMQVSALKNTGVEELLERVFLESEVLELKCHDNGPARGIVLESEIQQGKGRIAHLLVQNGRLQRGDVILAGEGYGKVRSILSDRGGELKSAGPATPVEVSGLNELPGVGDEFHVVDSLDQAKDVAEERARKSRKMNMAERRQISHENLLQAVAEQAKKNINVIVKTDVAGSAEVLKEQVEALSHPEVDVKLIASGVGQVSESDVDLAITSNAVVFAFHVSTNSKARLAAERAGIEIRYHEIIYEMLDELRAMMEGALSPEVREEVTAHVEIRRVFKSSKLGNIAGCYVLDGTVGRDQKARVTRDGAVVQTTQIASLKREKDDAREVREGFECGIVLKDFDDIREGDVLETYKVVESRRLLKL